MEASREERSLERERKRASDDHYISCTVLEYKAGWQLMLTCVIHFFPALPPTIIPPITRTAEITCTPVIGLGKIM